MGTKISKKKYMKYREASENYKGDTAFFLLSYDKQSELNGLTPRENWYIYKHSGKLYVIYMENGEYGDELAERPLEVGLPYTESNDRGEV